MPSATTTPAGLSRYRRPPTTRHLSCAWSTPALLCRSTWSNACSCHSPGSTTAPAMMALASVSPWCRPSPASTTEACRLPLCRPGVSTSSSACRDGSHSPARLRSRPLLDPACQQFHDFGDARGPHLRPAGRRVNPAQISLAVKLSQGVEERRGRRIGLKRGRDVVGEIGALRAFGLQFNNHLITDCDAGVPHPHRIQGEHPPVAVRRDRPAQISVAVSSGYRLDPPANGVVSLSAPYLVGVEWNHNDRLALGIRADMSIEPLSAHGFQPA